MLEESIFPLHTPNPPITQPSSVPEHLSLLLPELVNLALPESDNKDEYAPQPLLAPPELHPTTSVPPPVPPSPVRCSTQISHCIQWPDPINISTDQH